MNRPVLDHIVLAGPDLGDALAWFAARTGVVPTPGGSHVGRGTRNHLVDLGAGSYLEIIGPDPEQPEPAEPRPFGVDELSSPTVVTWAVRTHDIGSTLAASRRRGYDPGAAAEMSRRTASGELLVWRLTPPTAAPGHPIGVLPFVIDWGATSHPTTASASGHGLASTPMLDFSATHPEPEPQRVALAALGVELTLDGGPEALRLVVRGSDGEAVAL